MRIPSLLFGIILGACAGTAATTVATNPGAPAPQVQETAATHPTATVIHLQDAERRSPPSGKAAITLLAKGHNAFLGRLEMAAGGKVPLHRDGTEEYIHILEGNGVITIDGQHHDVAPGTTVYMPANAEVTYQNGKDPLVAIQVFAGPAPAQKYDAWAPATP